MKYKRINSIPRDEREALYELVIKDLKPLERRHGKDVLRWAVNRYVEHERDRQRITREKKRLEEELAALDSK